MQHRRPLGVHVDNSLLVLVESHGMREGVHERFQLREALPFSGRDP
jgi:hypothetical protein